MTWGVELVRGSGRAEIWKKREQKEWETRLKWVVGSDHGRHWRAKGERIFQAEETKALRPQRNLTHSRKARNVGRQEQEEEWLQQGEEGWGPDNALIGHVEDFGIHPKGKRTFSKGLKPQMRRACIFKRSHWSQSEEKVRGK